MGLDADCPECGSGEYDRADDEVACPDCGFTYRHLTDQEVSTDG